MDSFATPEPQSAGPKPGRRPFQFSLRALFGLTCVTAIFFSVASTLGYVDALAILASIVVLVGVMAYPRRVHLPTGIVLTVVAGLLLGANLRRTRWAREFNEMPPAGLDPVAKSMFYRGWPLCPFMTAPISRMTFRTNEPAVYGTLLVDGILFVVALFIVRGVSEWCLRWRAKLVIKTPHGTSHPPTTPPSAGSTSGPPLE